MMMTCGHVISKDSLQKLGKGNGWVSVNLSLISDILILALQAGQMPILPCRICDNWRIARHLLSLSANSGPL